MPMGSVYSPFTDSSVIGGAGLPISESFMGDAVVENDERVAFRISLMSRLNGVWGEC